MNEQLKLVVAEDNDTDAALIARHLAWGGIKCTMRRVQTEFDFVEAIKDLKPDVIISDFSMPQFDGRRALAIAGVRAPDTPFLFVSGTLGEQRAIDALQCGATDYILKSNMARLPAAVQRAVREASVKTAQRHSQQQLRSSEEQLRATVETSQDWIWEVDTAGRFRFCSPAVASILGYEPGDLIGADYRRYVSDGKSDQATALLPAPGEHQLTGAIARWHTRDGQLRWLERNVTSVLDDAGQIVGYRGIDRDITSRMEQETRQQRLTRSCRMLGSTGSAILRLRNRSDLLQELCRIAVHQGGYDRVSISLLDPNAKVLQPQAWAGNDAKPLLALDSAQLDWDSESASIAEWTIRSGLPMICNDLNLAPSPIARRQVLLDHGYQSLATLPILIGGTVIGIITLFSDQNAMFDDPVTEVLQELSANLGYALQFLEKDASLSIRYGVAMFPDDAISTDTLVQYAEASRAAAREDSEKYLPYISIAHRSTSRAFALESRLAGALERDEFVLHYQPKVSLRTGRIEGFEALLRWQDALEGLVSPSTIIPLLERSGAIVDVGAWVLLQAAHDIHLWREAGFPDIRVAVNVSPLQLRRRDFVSQVLSCIGSSKGRADIDIELTENMLMQNIELSTNKLTELRSAGIGVAIDDFGTGYSCLRLLAGLPVNSLKIDRSFILGAEATQGGMTLVSTIVSLARAFGMHTVAEGVETQEQLDMLRGLGCDQAQGYVFARPAPGSDVPLVISQLQAGGGS